MASKNKPNEPVMYTRSEAADFISVSETYLGPLVKKEPTLAAGVVVDRWPGTKIKRWRISEAALRLFLVENKDKPRKSTGPVRKAIRFEDPALIPQVETFLATIGLKLETIWKQRVKATAATSTNGATVTSDTGDDEDEDLEEGEDLEGEEGDGEFEGVAPDGSGSPEQEYAPA